MDNDQILNSINELIEEEHGMSREPEDTLISSEIDSFGIIVILLELDSKYTDLFSKEYLDTINFEVYTIQDMIDRIQNGTD